MVAMHWQETFYTPTAPPTQTKCSNISTDKVLQVKKALHLPCSAQRQLHYSWVTAASKSHSSEGGTLIC